MDVFYNHEIVDFPELGVVAGETIQIKPMPKGDPWPDDIVLAAGREESWKLLTSYKRVKAGDPKFLVPRKHLHGFGCPRDARTPLVIRENSGYSHEPTAVGKAGLLPEWQHIHDNHFLAEAANTGRLANNIREFSMMTGTGGDSAENATAAMRRPGSAPSAALAGASALVRGDGQRRPATWRPVRGPTGSSIRLTARPFATPRRW